MITHRRDFAGERQRVVALERGGGGDGGGHEGVQAMRDPEQQGVE